MSRLLSNEPTYKLVTSKGTKFYRSVSRLVTAIMLMQGPSAVYHKNDGQWQKLADFDWPAFCGCGRSFTDNETGEYIARRDIQTIRFNHQGIIDYSKQPVQCQGCKWKKEYDAGRWCPKYWKERFM